MAYNKDQNEPKVPVSNVEKRTSSDLLPRFYRTKGNKKFLQATLDQLIQPGTVKKINGYIGRETAKAVKSSDIFLQAADITRQNYQLEPAAVIQDYLGNTTFFKDYIDHINHIGVFDGVNTNHSRLNKQEFYSWNPHISWDKFVNYQQYYWLPFGPDPIEVLGNQLEIQSTYTVKGVDEEDNVAYLFTPNGLTRNPTLRLFRGQTYTFDIDAEGHPFSIKTQRTSGNLNRYTYGVDKFAVEKGTITFTVPVNAPDVLFYVSENAVDTGGVFHVLDIDENTSIDLTQDFLGKKDYIIPNGTSKGLRISNGMKLSFGGQVTPEKYETNFWYVEGVGTAIRLVSDKDLEVKTSYNVETNILFDDTPFDQLPFGDASTLPGTKDYITINRASPDLNPWSRYNRWFHQDVVVASALANGQVADLDQTFRATRPIIEFDAGIKLHNYGLVSKQAVDVIDNFTTDVFSTIEGSLGYNVDGIDLATGMRVLFTADLDSKVKDKIFKVNFVDVTPPARQISFIPEFVVDVNTNIFTFPTEHGLPNYARVTYLVNGNDPMSGLTNRQVYYVKVLNTVAIELHTTPQLNKQADIFTITSGTHKLEVYIGKRRQIYLEEAVDSSPILYETVAVNYGTVDTVTSDIKGNQGQTYWYNGTTWKLAQLKTAVNQPPLFDVFDSNEISYSDNTVYDGSTFTGTKIFSYKVGTGTADPTLKFPLTYQNINNIGDIVFEFNLLTDSFAYKNVTDVLYKNTDVGYLKVSIDFEQVSFENAWTTSLIEDAQPVVRVFKESNLTNNFPIDVYDDKNDLADLEVRVYINGKRLAKNLYTIVDAVIRKIVNLNTDVALTDVVTLRCFAKQTKNNNGYYEIPGSLQNNPLNNNVEKFTLGEVIDHVDSIIDNISTFDGAYPGNGNLRDLGNLAAYGTRFVQHSGPINLSLYHLGNKSTNVINALDQARNDYGKFKRSFIIAATDSGIDTDARRHVDFVLQQVNKDRPKTSPYFLTDMFGYTASNRIEYTVLDARIKTYPLTNKFNLTTLSNKSVNIYLNGEQLIHGRDYQFGDDVFFELLIDISEDDLIEAYEYETTDGCFCPATPSKLGLYPKFEPKKYIDDTYVEPTEVIQGHDGSITVAFGDYRDDLILELETRIFNNIKVNYDSNIFDIWEYVPGYNRDTAYTREEFDKILSKYFFQWTSNIQQDYTKHIGYDQTNTFTYNYRGNYSPAQEDVPAAWRGIYKWYFDTDRPHTNPWECIGYSIEPRWWQEVYGPAPYTSDNLILWDDIKQGIVREPGVPIRRLTKFAKPILNSGLPVNDQGVLLSPLDAGLVQGFIRLNDGGYFVFGDQSTVESAWRRSSYLPFALITTCLLMQPNAVLGRCLDRNRVIRNKNSQLIYSNTGLRIRLQDILIPSTANRNNNTRTYTSGLINYIVDYLSSENTAQIDAYASDLQLLTNKIATKLGAFTSQAKYKILLDSKNPSSTGGVFVPEENYFVDLNVSSAIRKVIYSGVMITKFADGFELRGYNFDNPYFTYYGYRQDNRVINVGGISESYINWNGSQLYTAGKLVKANNQYYRVKSTHTTGEVFDDQYYVRLAELPVTGGREAIIRKSFDSSDVQTIAYGTKLTTIQEVADVLQGYGAYLEDQGFVFDDFNNEMGVITNWETSVKEFMFWSTQNWSVGAVISLSPSANKLIFKSDISVVGDITDPFYSYSVYRVDGQKLDPEFISTYRNDGVFTIEPENTNYGIFGITLYLLQKEHIVVLDNTTLFNDTIYDQEAGYRQERIKVIGYTTSNWKGSFEIPGFIYDQAIINAWEPWTDYNLGDIVKHKEFYYSAGKFLIGTQEFENENWILLEEKPKAALLPNWDYKAETFTDFYDLDTDNFDAGQQKIAQHLIGYQKRQYLENIIQNDVSQYKFYQGMIIEKGTQNVLNKLFDVLSADGQDSLTFDEEWAFRVGEYGAVDTFDEIEFALNESQFKINPQPVELVSTIDPTINDFVYRQRPSDIYIKPLNYTNDIWPISTATPYLRTPGYVKTEDVKLSVDKLDDLLTYDIASFIEGEYVWCAFENRSWNVYRFSKTAFNITDVSYANSVVTVSCNKTLTIESGDIVGIEGSDKLAGFHKVVSVSLNTFTVSKKIEGWTPFADADTILSYIFNQQRIGNVDDANSIIPRYIKPDELFWADDTGNGTWTTYKNAGVFRKGSLLNSTPTANLKFGSSTAVDQTGNIAAVVDRDGVTVYEKGSSDNLWSSTYRLLVDPTMSATTPLFGSTVKFSQDGKWLAVAAQDASGIDYGYVSMYKRELNGAYTFFRLFKSPTPASNEKYGSSICFGRKTNPEAVYTALTGSYDNTGTGARWTVRRVGALYSVTNSVKGVSYSIGDTIVISGSELGGDSPDNNLTITVNNVNAATGAIESFAYTGTGLPDTYFLAIAAQGYNANQGRVYTYQYSENAGWSLLGFLPTATISGDQFGYDIAMSGTGGKLIVSAPAANQDTGNVFVYSFNPTLDLYQLSQTISGSINDDAERFGESIAISNSGDYIAVGAPLINVGSKKDVGQVLIYKRPANNTSALHLLYQTIDSPRKEVNERYGTDIEFMNGEDTLVVFSKYGDIENIATLDSGDTTFDNNSLQLLDVESDIGRIDIFDRYNTKFIYGESLKNSSVPLSGYGNEIAVGSNVILVSAINEIDTGAVNSGNVYSYVKTANTTSWSVLHSQIAKVDVSKIKKAFLYNKVTNQIVKYLDVIDPIQGEIPGIADQEIKYKTYFDPAVYSIGTDEVIVDDGMNWTSNQVGMLWWDLTNAKFIDTQTGDVIYRTSTWNKLYDTASIDVYEWVETTLLPSAWNKIADTESGYAKGVSGTTKHGDNIYSVKKRYDSISKTFKETYYYWVKNKKITPNVEGRQLSSSDVANLISDPVGYGYSCIAFTSTNSFSLINCEQYLQGTDVVLSVQYWLSDVTNSNFHSQWKLLSTNRNTIIPTAIETKWFHSLVGKDANDRVVPDINLPTKQRYGIEFRPRQSMFVNRIEALKQVIERTNSSLRNVLIADDYDLSDLEQYEAAPSTITGLWDITIDTDSELRFVSTVLAQTASLDAVLEDGRVTAVNIIRAGAGYGKLAPVPVSVRSDSVDIDGDPVLWYGPNAKIFGSGAGAVIKTIVDSTGGIVDTVILNQGEGYDAQTFMSVRDFSVLVLSDSSTIDTWSVYSWNFAAREWLRVRSQSYNVRKYWDYIDWFDTGYNQFIKVDYLVENTYELVTTDISIGEIAKVRNVGSGGWLLLEKYSDLQTIDYTLNFKVIGRQNGTIQFSDKLYNFADTTLGYDGPLFDSDVFDNSPTTEIRIILNTLRDNILVDELRIEYLKLFFSSVRYAMYEQTFLDWAFKTSFVKSMHNVGELQQKVTYNSDNLEFFEEYIKEVKPYRTTIREYVSNYAKLENSETAVTDFDLLPVIDEALNVTPLTVSVTNTGQISTSYDEINTYPWKFWKDNLGFEITSLQVIANGRGYVTRPVVEIIGPQLPGGIPAEAKAYIANGSVYRVDLTNPGSGYITTPRVRIVGGVNLATGRAASVVAQLGNGVIRSSRMKIKFDRISKTYEITNLTQIETFIGTGTRTQFGLRWSPDINIGNSYVTVNSIELLRDQYSLAEVELGRGTATQLGYTSYSGLITFETAPARGASILVEYKKDFRHLSATDRITHYYNPTTGMLGKDFAQLMSGVDYGGVQITGLDFGISVGWDALPWFTESWDSVDPTFEDYILTFTGSRVEVLVDVNGSTPPAGSGFVLPENSETMQIEVGWIMQDAAGQEHTVIFAAHNVLFDGWGIGFAVALSGLAWPLTFTSPGYANEFRMPYVPELGQDINIYISKFNEDGISYSPSIRVDDPDFATINQTNNNAIMTTFVGDGEVDIIILPSTANLDFNDRIIFRKDTSDGSYAPRDDEYDTQLTGGDLAYSSATGVAPDDIILDGDSLVSATTSNAPEEVVPGQVMDTVAIKVFHRPSGGCPNILFTNYQGDGSTTNYSIGQYFPNDSSVVIKVENTVLEIVTDYTIDYQNNLISFITAPNVGDTISIMSISFNSANVLDLDYFVSDGTTTEYITRANWLPTMSSTVLVNGQITDYLLFSTDDQYTAIVGQTWRSRTGIRFAEPPAAGAIINYIIDTADIEQTASVVKNETITYVTGTSTYQLTNIVGVNSPLDQNILVKNNQAILKPASANYFTMQNDNLSYALADHKYVGVSIDTSDIKVYKDADLLTFGPEYTVLFDYADSLYGVLESSILIDGGTGYVLGETLDATGGTVGPSGSGAKFQVTQINGVGTIQQIELIDAGSYITAPTSPFMLVGGTGTAAAITAEFDLIEDHPNITINLKPGMFTDNAKLTVLVDSNADYVINSNNTITFNEIFADGTPITITSYYNHNILGIERTIDTLVPAISVTNGTTEYYELSGKLGGLFKLRNTAVAGDFVWVIKNSEFLMHNIDYVLEDDLITVRLKDYLFDTDIIQIMAFTNTVVHENFAYMQFKDMLNRVHYKRLNKAKSTLLSKDLTQFDVSITVDDSTVLDTPNAAKNVPGIIEINGERIEYFVKVGNVLSQIRRGTLGTGVPVYHSKDSNVQNIGSSETIPYKDEFIVTTHTSDGVSNIVALPYIPKINDMEVFVGGLRLKKKQYKIYGKLVGGVVVDPEYPESTAGDITLPAEFSITGRAELRLTTIPPMGVKISVIKKQGKLWNDVGQRLAKSNNSVANFIKEAASPWVDTYLDKYENRIVSSDGNPLQTGDGEPLEY